MMRPLAPVVAWAVVAVGAAAIGLTAVQAVRGVVADEPVDVLSAADVDRLLEQAGEPLPPVATLAPVQSPAALAASSGEGQASGSRTVVALGSPQVGGGAGSPVQRPDGASAEREPARAPSRGEADPQPSGGGGQLGANELPGSSSPVPITPSSTPTPSPSTSVPGTPSASPTPSPSSSPSTPSPSTTPEPSPTPTDPTSPSPTPSPDGSPSTSPSPAPSPSDPTATPSTSPSTTPSPSESTPSTSPGPDGSPSAPAPSATDPADPSEQVAVPAP